jgi:hypothetical protein
LKLNGSLERHEYVRKTLRHFIPCNESKYYNEDGQLIRYEVYHNFDDTFHYRAYISSCEPSSHICYYYMCTSMGYMRYIIRRYPRNNEDFIIDLFVINPIRYIQRRFITRLYKFILLILNEIIEIDVISNLILSYLKN